MLFLAGPDSRYKAHIWAGSETFCRAKTKPELCYTVYETTRGSRICRKCWDVMDDHARFEAFNDAHSDLDHAEIKIELYEDAKQRAELRQMNTSQANAAPR